MSCLSWHGTKPGRPPRPRANQNAVENAEAHRCMSTVTIRDHLLTFFGLCAQQPEKADPRMSAEFAWATPGALLSILIKPDTHSHLRPDSQWHLKSDHLDCSQRDRHALWLQRSGGQGANGPGRRPVQRPCVRVPWAARRHDQSAVVEW